MGAVYLAEDLNLAGRLVAVKENLNNSEDAQRQFRREAVLLAHLRHANLPQVIDYFVDESGHQYLVMEYVPGENMQEALTANGALPIAEALTCIDQVMQAVAYMHRQRDPETGHSRAIVHRDIKPSNIKRTPEGRYVLVDFGIAKVQSQTAATAVSARALTPGYAPIEQYHGGTDERSDIYALGATLYALVTGHAPPSATSMASGAPLPPPRTYNSKVPASVSKVIERAMRMQFQDRYPRVTEMYEALFNRSLPTTPGAITPIPSQSPARPDRTTRLVIGVVVVVTVLAVWWLLASGTIDDSSASRPAPTDAAQVVVVVTATLPATPIGLATSANVATAIPPPISTDTELPTGTPTGDVDMLAASETASAAVALPSEKSTVTPLSGLEAKAATTLQTTSPLALAVIASGVVTSPTARPTSTQLPTATPLPTSTATATRVPPPTREQQPPIAGTPVATSNLGGPRSATIIQPPDPGSSNTPTTFSWRSDADLAPGQEFEVIFWNPQSQNESQGGGWVRSSRETSIVIPADKKAAGTYKWALYLVTPDPYVRIRPLAGPFTFSIPGAGDGSGPGPYPPPRPGG